MAKWKVGINFEEGMSVEIDADNEVDALAKVYTLVEGIIIIIICKYLVLVVCYKSVVIYFDSPSSRKTSITHINKVAILILLCQFSVV